MANVPIDDLPSKPTPEAGHWVSYPRFLMRAVSAATDGSFAFYAWMTGLTAVFLVGVNAWGHQVTSGMIHTHMTDHVSWGLYIANFTFMVGVVVVMSATAMYSLPDNA